jgi:hypothetical protein
MQHRTETKVGPSGTIILRGLPFPVGGKVVVVITTQVEMDSPITSYSLRGLKAEYKNPFEPVAEVDWSVLP